MPTLTDENRELLLSMYLDGELDAEQARQVEERIRSDEAWKTEYAALTESDTRVSKVIETNWHDESFTEKVKARVRSIPLPPTVVPPPSPPVRRRMALLLITVALTIVAAFLVLQPPPTAAPAVPTPSGPGPAPIKAPPTPVAPAAWRNAWAQLGGSPSHTGLSAARGPAAPASARFFPFPSVAVSAGPETDHVPAVVVSAEGRVYAACTAPADMTQLYALDLNLPNAAWRACGAPLPGRAAYSPVIAAQGLVATGTTGRVVEAWDPVAAKPAWRKDVNSAVHALCATPDGLLLCSTFQGLVALTSSGDEAWAFDGFGDFLAPACVRADGSIVACSRSGRLVILDPRGKVLHTRTNPPVISEAGWPGVASVGGAVWLTTPRGDAVALDDEGHASKLVPQSAAWSAWPLASGVLAAGNTLHFLRGVKVRLPLEGQITALAGDATGSVYAGMKGRVYVISADENGSVEIGAGSPKSHAVQSGEILRGGLAIVPGRLIVTTTEGVQVFE
jgi:hypothetical protein